MFVFINFKAFDGNRKLPKRKSTSPHIFLTQIFVQLGYMQPLKPLLKSMYPLFYLRLRKITLIRAHKKKAKCFFSVKLFPSL